MPEETHSAHRQGLTEIPEIDQALAEQLKNLDLRFNQITISSPSLNALPQLKSLDLRRNLVTSFDSAHISSCRDSLEKLQLCGNRLKELPDLSFLTSLRSLMASNNLLTGFSGALLPVSLEELDVHCNFLTALPDDIGRLVNLENLSFTRNKIKKIPSSFSQLVKLEQLNLSGNEVQSVDFILNLPQLKIIGCNSNLITELPQDIGALSNLLTISFHHNNLQYLPGSLHHPPNLSRIDVSYNPFVTDPLSEDQPNSDQDEPNNDQQQDEQQQDEQQQDEQQQDEQQQDEQATNNPVGASDFPPLAAFAAIGLYRQHVPTGLAAGLSLSTAETFFANLPQANLSAVRQHFVACDNCCRPTIGVPPTTVKFGRFAYRFRACCLQCKEDCTSKLQALTETRMVKRDFTWAQL